MIKKQSQIGCQRVKVGRRGIDFYETFVLVVRLEVIHILLTFASHVSIRLFQMDVNCSFLNGYLNEELYVK